MDTYTTKRLIALKNLGNHCVCCGERCVLVLEIDHINEDGRVDKGKHYQNTLLLAQGIGLERFQILCANCHTIKTKLCRNLGKPISIDKIRDMRKKYEEKQAFIKPIFERPLS